MWMVRNHGGEFAEEFIQQGVVAVGWKEAGSLAGLRTRDQIIQRVKETWPDYKPMQAVTSGSQLDKIANVIKSGDRVVTYDPTIRKYHAGVVIGDYQFNAGADDAMANRRAVRWESMVDRDRLSAQTRNSLGSTLTIFAVPEPAEKEILALIAGSSVDPVDLATEFGSVSEQLDVDNIASLRTRAREAVKDRMVALTWDEMQLLVAGMLRAMGYKTQVSAPGSDRGKDIVASPDGFGFEQPRIVVEVKHRPTQQMRSQDIRSYLGGRHKDDRGLYVSTGGFTKDAKYEADRAAIALALMDIDALADAVLAQYDAMDIDTRTLLPLTKLHWPS
jgi:restriction system protein